MRVASTFVVVLTVAACSDGRGNVDDGSGEGGDGATAQVGGAGGSGGQGAESSTGGSSAQGGGSAELLLTLDWGTATGNTSEAVSDGGKGLLQWCAWDEVLSVVTGAPLGWTRSENVLAIQSIDGCGHVELEELFPLPVDGEEQFWAIRYYAMNGAGQTDTKQHPHCFWPVGAIEAVHLGISTFGFSGGDWTPNPRWTFAGGEFPFGLVPKNDAGTVMSISAGSWIRYELILHWRNATEFRWYPRVYDLEGTLLWDESDFHHTDTGLTLADWYASSEANVLNRSEISEDPNNIRTFSFGMGQAGSSGGHFYIADAAFALASGPDDFIGPR